MWNPFAVKSDRPDGRAPASPIPGVAPPTCDCAPITPAHEGSAAAAPADAPSTAAATAPAPADVIPMPRSIAEVEVIGSTAVATLTVTELSRDIGAEELAELLVKLAETGALHFVLDVQNVQYMDSACLGCMVQALNTLAARGGRIAVVNPNHSVHYIFKLTRLDRVFRVCSTVPAALQAVEAA